MKKCKPYKEYSVMNGEYYLVIEGVTVWKVDPSTMTKIVQKINPTPKK